jgi:endo-1,4-beta-xylanase
MSGYRDDTERKIMGETLIVKELIPAIDAKYRTIPTRDGRAVCGFSMGGGGAIRLAVTHPDLFSTAASWAAALGSRGASTPTADLVKQNAGKLRGKVRFLLIVGDQDPTYASHAAVLDALKAAKIDFKSRILPDVNHNLGTYYTQTGSMLVRFVGDGYVEFNGVCGFGLGPRRQSG